MLHHISRGPFARPAPQHRFLPAAPRPMDRASPATRGRRPKSVEGRDLDGDHPRQSNRAPQCRRNQIRWASSALRERAALLRSANARSRLKFFRWFGNCQGSTAIHRLLEPSLFFSGLGQRHKAVRQQTSGGREVADVLRAVLLLAQLHLGISCA